MWVIFLLSLPPILLIFVLLKKVVITKKNDDIKPMRELPGPPRIPIIGNLHQLGSLPHRSLQSLSRKYGPVMLLQLGKVPVIVISSAEAAMEVLKIHDAKCCSRPSLASSAKLSYNNRDISFSPYGESWREVRKVCVLKLFTAKTVRSFRSVREEEVKSLIDCVHESSLSSSPVDISEKMMALTASIIFRTAFGKLFSGSGLDNDSFQEIVHRAMKVFGSFAASDFFRYTWIIDRLSGFHARLERSFRELDGFFERVINEHLGRTMPEDQQDLVDLLLKMEEEQSECGQEVIFTRETTKALIMDIFLAGVDTSAIALTWAMTELARNPRVMNKAIDEARSYAAFKEKLSISEDNVHQLQYLKMVVKETIRMHPPIPVIPRETIYEFNLCGHKVSPKTMIQINVSAIGRDPYYWDNPEEFFPERFVDSSVDYKGLHFEFLPFGSGRRGCPGIHMGISTVELALANLLCCFDWKLPDGMKETDIDMEELDGIAVHKKFSLKLIPISYQEWAKPV